MCLATMNQNLNGQSETSENICRICLDSTEEPTVSPCECKGTMSLVHISCLERWLSEAARNTCELCQHRFTIEYVVRYSVGQSLYQFLCMKNTSHDQNTRGLWADIGITLIITPITIGVIYFCALAADFYSKDRFSKLPPARFTTFMLFLMVGIIALGYYLWMYMAVQYHARLWYSWWQSCVTVKVEYPQKHEFGLLHAKENATIYGEHSSQSHTDNLPNGYGSNLEFGESLDVLSDTQSDSVSINRTQSYNPNTVSKLMQYVEDKQHSGIEISSLRTQDVQTNSITNGEEHNTNYNL